MGLVSWIKERWEAMLRRQYVRDVFGVVPRLSADMEAAIRNFYNITAGQPKWLSDDVKTINFASFIDDVTAGLTALDLKITVDGGERGKLLQKQAEYILQVMQDKVAEGLGNVGIMFKPNGENVDYVEAGDFIPTEVNSNGDILGCVFKATAEDDEYIYTKLEWHRFEYVTNENGDREKVYRISNAAFKSKNDNSLGDPCSLGEVAEWAGLEPDAMISNVDAPMFGYFRCPGANRIDRRSPLGVPIWINCQEELRDLDVAWTRMTDEIEDSTHITFLPQTAIQSADQENVKLPRYIKQIMFGGVGDENKIHEHVSTLLTTERKEGINAILSMISNKCGFSQDFFQLDERTGVITATQVEADDQATIRTIKNIRDALETAIRGVLYGLDRMADIYSTTRPEAWTAEFHFGDITYNFEEDRQHHYSLALQGKYPWRLYYTKYLGYGEKEAIELIKEAKQESLATGTFAMEE